MTAKKILILEEGWRARPYRDTEGFPTVGFGFKIGGKGEALPTELILPRNVGELWLQNLVDDLYERMEPRLKGLDPVRKSVLVSMAYQLGVFGVYNFKRMWDAINKQDWDKAASEMLDSVWARQTPARAKRMATLIKSGNYYEVYDDWDRID